jgi:S1-C subfamily serine protease
VRLRGGLAATLAGAALALGACGGGDGGDGGGESARTTEERPERGLDVAPRDPAAGFDPEEIYRRDGDGVVTIISVGLDGGRSEAAEGLGSGFVISDEGEVVTNAHVVSSGEGAAIRQARQVFVKFASGDRLEARIVGLDPFSDIALLRLRDAGDVELRPLELGEVEDLRVGEPVAAIGSPFGEERSLSTGVVSALDRSIRSLTGFSTNGAIQTDAAINSGNSGGPLLDGEGRVIGVNSQIRTRDGDNSGVGFAIPSNVVANSVEQLREDGRVEYPYLGLSTQEVYPQLAERFDLGTESGAWVQTVEDGAPARRAGIRGGGSRPTVFQGEPYLTGGDVITKVGDREIERAADVALALEGRRPGEEITLTLRRDGEEREVQVTLGRRPVELDRG